MSASDPESALLVSRGFGCQVVSPWTAFAFDTGTPIGMISDHGSGRVYMWGDEWVEYSMNFGNNVTQFWQNAIDWLTHRI